MQALKNGFFLALGLLIIAWSFYTFWNRPAPTHYQNQSLSLRLGEGGGEVKVEIADTDTERTRGLSGREALADGSGMLFIFPELGLHGIWMKEMKFPIDIVWIDENWFVVGVERGATPESFPEVFYPPVAIRYVLELPVNSSIDIGDKVLSDR